MIRPSVGSSLSRSVACAVGRAVGRAVGLAVALTVALASSLGPRPLHAQARPDLEWRTLTTARFRVHFAQGLEELARRTAINADSAFERLARELPAPRGVIDIIVTDHLDWSNGSATPFPTNRIVIHARPPVDELSLRNQEDWNLSVVTHEMAHIFQLDRAEGWWGVARKAFGRAAPFYPNTYAPSWLLEGMAVHYETRFTRGGRLAGSEFPAYANALAAEGALPPITGLALPNPFFPGGNATYIFGSFLMEQTLRHDGSFSADTADTADTADAAARLIARMSSRVNPWRLDASARTAVGARFTELYNSWRDSVNRAVRSAPQAVAQAAPPAAPPVAPPVAPQQRTHTLVAPTWTIRFPRFLASGDLVAVLEDQRLPPALVRVSESGRLQRVARRNSVDANAPTGDGRTLRGELERTDPYAVSSDLYLGEGFGRRRLTHGARLAHPDLHRGTQRVVAVRTIPGATELVLLSLENPDPVPLALGTLDQSWSEPRFAPSGTRVAAALWERGGRTSIVVLDLHGEEIQRFSPRAADGSARLVVVSAPAWFPGDTTLVFVSDHEGAPMIYRGDLRSGAYERLWSTTTALNTPDISADGRQVAAVELRAAGWALVVTDLTNESLASLATAAPPVGDATPLPALAPLPVEGIGSERITPFDARVTLAPSWWLPSAQSSDDATVMLGGFTFGRDVIGRHRWNAALLRDLTHPEFTIRGGYEYAGLGNPTLSFSGSQEWAHGAINSGGDRVGTLARRNVTFSTAVIALRPRLRHSVYALLQGEVEYRSYRTYPSSLLRRLSGPDLTGVAASPRAVIAVGGSTMQRAALAVSPQDGIEGQLLYRYRPKDGIARAPVGETIARGAIAKSIPLPGFARHVIAARAAVGVTDPNSLAFLHVGGVSGSTLEILPGIEIGDAERTFFVRGFAPSAQVGVRAAAGSAEYRLPVLRVGRGVGLLPVFLQKVSLVGFADAGAAWCEAAVTGSPVCGAPVAPRSWIASAGGELTLDAALQYDVLYRFRLGFARPVRGADPATRATTFYFTLGNTF